MNTPTDPTHAMQTFPMTDSIMRVAIESLYDRSLWPVLFLRESVSKYVQHIRRHGNEDEDTSDLFDLLDGVVVDFGPLGLVLGEVWLSGVFVLGGALVHDEEE